MPRYQPEPPYRHGDPRKPGVLLVNLGSPQAPTPSAVRAYLRQFLSDPRVVELPRALWLPLLYSVVLSVRPRASARRYAAIWSPDGAPLVVHTARQSVMLRGYLGERHPAAGIEVQWAMRYGAPSIEHGMQALRARGCDRILVLPLYPQYSASTTASAVDAVNATLPGMRNVPALRFVKHFHDHPSYIAALAQSVRDYWMQHGRGEHLLISFHGVPRFTLDRGDPYHCECQATGRLLAQALGLPAERFRIAFQSRFGRARWLEPYTADVLQQLGRDRIGRLDVICPGFVSDCLETLEEIALEGRALFLGAGGGSFHYIPCLNERNDWLHALADIASSHLGGWLEPADRNAADASRARALALGAKD
jgi:ferrochelatase